VKSVGVTSVELLPVHTFINDNHRIEKGLATVKLIAEPWDCGPGGYQAGRFPAGWAECNDKFRDTVRDYWRGEASAAALAPRLTASGDVFNHSGRRAWASVNFITAHDGFTLNDLVTYNEKHNEANSEDNRTATRTTAPGIAGTKGRPTIPASPRSASGRFAIFSPPCFCRRARR
jgi:pullulanase/glycogen debranching enzyme